MGNEAMHYQDLHDGKYDSISDFLSAMRQGCRNAANKAEWHAVGFEGKHYGAHWFGADCRDGNAVQTKVMEGWQEGRDRMNTLRDQMGTVDLRPVDRRRKLTRMDHGDILDIHQVYAGRLDTAWQKPTRRVTSGPQKIDICANMICSGGEVSDVLFWRGAAAVVLADMLEQAGYMVRLVVNFGGSHYEEKNKAGRVSCRVTVKDHGMPFDVTSTSAVIMPGFFRSIGHAWIVAHCISKISTCGISVGVGDVEPGEINLSHQVRDQKTALAFVNKIITDINENTLAA